MLQWLGQCEKMRVKANYVQRNGKSDFQGVRKNESLLSILSFEHVIMSAVHNGTPTSQH